MRRLILLLVAAFLSVSISHAQTPLSHQGWQSVTISGGAINVSCAALILPVDKGSLLVETSPTTIRGEMDSSLRSSHPIRVILQPETGTSDILTTISGCNIDGAVIQLAIADVGDVITVEHNEGAIQFVDALDYSINDIAEILTLVRKNGVFVPSGGGGGGGSSGGNIIVSGDQRIDFSTQTQDGPNKGLIVPASTNCAFATGFLQFCFDHDDKIIYIGTGTGITAIAGSGVSGCFGLDQCFDLGQTIDGLNGRDNALKLLDSNRDGVLIYVDATGLVFECVTDFGGVSESGCLPTEIRAFEISPGGFVPDGSLFTHNFTVALNSRTVNVTLTAADNDNAIITIDISMPDRWDGERFKIKSFLHSLSASPSGVLDIDWTGYCVIHGAPNAHNTFPAATANSSMPIALSGHAQHDLIITSTVGDIPLTGCTADQAKVLWLRGKVDSSTTTASNINEQHIFKFLVSYGSKDFTD